MLGLVLLGCMLSILLQLCDARCVEHDAWHSAFEIVWVGRSAVNAMSAALI